MSRLAVAALLVAACSSRAPIATADAQRATGSAVAVDAGRVARADAAVAGDAAVASDAGVVARGAVFEHLADVPLLTLDGTPTQLGAYARKVTVIAFWGTFCEPCLLELPQVELLARRYAADPDVAVLAVSVDSPARGKKPYALVEKKARKLGLTMPVLIADTAESTRFMPSLSGAPAGVTPMALPLLVVIDADGRMLHQVGYMDGERPADFVSAHAALIERARRRDLPVENSPTMHYPAPPGGPPKVERTDANQ